MAENSERNEELFLGTNADTGEEVFLPVEALVRHVAIFGQSGSGKTVACKIIAEEAIRNNVPVIIVDLQGDISSLALLEKWEVLEQYGIPKALYEQFKEKLEVVIFTPASDKGVPLSINPLMFPQQEELDDEEKVMAIDGIATNLILLFDYKLSSTRGKAVKTYLISLFETLMKQDILVQDFNMLIDFIEKDYLYLPASKRTHLTKKEKQQLIRNITYFTVGASRLIFNMGVTLSIKTLIQPSSPNKVRIAIINLKTLEGVTGHSKRMKDLYISTLAQHLYIYVKANPKSSPQILFYLDEIAGLVPPHPKNPPTKRWIQLLFKEGRKFGLAMLVATQNISDVDYKAVGQAKTYFFGQFSTRQDIENVRKILLEDHQLSITAEELKRFQVGEFWLLSPEYFSSPVRLKTRRLYTKHLTLSDDDIEKLYQNPPPILSKEVREDFSYKEWEEDTLTEKLTIHDLEIELKELKELAEGTESLLDRQTGIERTETGTLSDEETISSSTQLQDTQQVGKTVSESTEIAKELYHKMPEIKEQYLKYDPHNFKELHQRFFEGHKYKFLGLEEHKIAYIPLLYVEFSISARRQLTISYADKEKQEEVTLDMVISRAFPLIDQIRFLNGEKIWGKDSISIDTEEAFDELINVLSMKNMSTLFSAPSSDILKIPLQRNPQQVFESFQDILLHDAMFYTLKWKEAIEKHLAEIEPEYKSIIEKWTKELQKQREKLLIEIDEKRKKVKKFQAQIEEAKAVYTTLKPLMETQYRYKSSTEVKQYKKAYEKIQYGPKVVRNYINEIESLISKIKEIDEKIAKSQEIRLKEDTNELIQQKSFVLPRQDELHGVYTTIIYIPVDLITYIALNEKGQKIKIHAISEAVLGTGLQILCDVCYATKSIKLKFVDIPRFCSICGVSLCEDHGLIDENTKELLCPDHAVTCSVCNKIVSVKNSKKCSFCDNYVCNEDVQYCSECKRPLCHEHAITKTVKTGLFKSEPKIFCPKHAK
ncbi:MAG: helicase HerA-like domain-containing protein [Candidatus Heimdallarchaeaceae archaeon]